MLPKNNVASWTQVQGLHILPKSHHASVQWNEFLVTFAGTRDAFVVNDVEVFDLKNQIPVPVKNETEMIPRHGHTMCVDNNGDIIVFGGLEGPLDHPRSSEDRVMFMIKMTLKLQSDFLKIEFQDMLGAENGIVLAFHTANIHQGNMYVFGGLDEYMETTDALFAYNINNMTWKRCLTVGVAPEKRFRHSSAIYEDKLFIFGGQDQKYPEAPVFNDLYTYNITSGEWTRINTLGKLPNPRTGASLHEYKGDLYLFGGDMEYNAQGYYTNFKTKHYKCISSDVYTYSIQNNTWSQLQTQQECPPARFDQSSTMWQNKIYVLGGSNGIDRELADLWYLSLGSEEEVDKEQILAQKDTKGIQITNKPFSLISLFTEKLFTDIILEADGKEFPAHKAILAERCRFFENLFNSGMSDASLDRLPIWGARAEAFEALLKFIYGDPNLSLDEDLAFELLELSDKYLLPELKTQCEKVLTELLNLDNFNKVAEAADRVESEVVKDVVFRFARVNAKALKDRGDLTRLPKIILLQLFEHLVVPK